MNTLLESMISLDGFRVFIENMSYYGFGFSLGLLYLTPACIAIRMKTTPLAGIAKIECLADCVYYVLGGSMYFAAIVFVYHLSSLPIALPIATFLLLPYWPTFILEPMLWVQRATSLLARLSIRQPVRLYTRTSGRQKDR